MAGNFWENDPVVEEAPQGGPRPLLTVPDPVGDAKRAADLRAEGRDVAGEARKDAANAWVNLTPPEAASLGLAADKVWRRNGLGKTEAVGEANTAGNPEAVSAARNKLQGVIEQIAEIETDATDNGGWFETGFTGSRLRNIPGTAAFDLANRIKKIDANSAFAALSELAKQGVKLTPVSNEEIRLAAQSVANLNPDMSQEEFLAELKKARTFYETALGGLPGGGPAQAPQDGSTDQAPIPPNAMTMLRFGKPQAPGGAGPGATQTSTPYPPELITAHDQMVAQLMVQNGGRLDPQAYATAKAELTQRFGYQPASSDADAAWAQSINAYLDAGGKTVPSGMQAENRDLSTIEQLRNTAADSPFGAYAAGAANALTGGTLDEIAGAVGGNEAGQQAEWAKDTLREERPYSSFAGEVSGAAMAMVPTARAAQALGKTALAGEMAYGAAYGAGDNNDNRLLGAAAGAAGAKAGDWIGGKLLQKFKRKIPADAGDEAAGEVVEALPDALSPAERYARAQRQGVDLSIGDVRGMGAKATERLLDVQPGSATVMNNARGRTREQLSRAADNVAAGYGSASTANSMGDALQSGARQWIARAKGAKGNPLDRGVVGKAYDAVPVPANAGAQFDNTLNALEELNSQFSSNPKLAAMMRDTRVSKLLDALGEVTAPEGPASGVMRTIGAKDTVSANLSWSDLKALRSAVGEDMQGVRIGSQDSRQSTLSRLYGALSEDMRATAAARGPAALAKFERANSLNRAVEARIEGSLTAILGKDGMQAPERAAAKLRAMTVSGRSTADFRQLAEIRKSMPASEWGEVSGALVRLLGQPASSEGRDFSADTFVRNFADMSVASKNLIFGGPNSTLRKNLDEFVGVAGDVAASNATRNTSNTGMAISGAIGFGAGGLPALITQAVGSYGAAKLWTHPGVVRWATGYTRMLKRAAETGKAPAEPAMKSQLAHLGRIAKGGGPVSADIIILKDYLANAAAQSPEKLAAEPREADRQ